MWRNSHETADLVTFTEEILNGKLYFLRSVYSDLCYYCINSRSSSFNTWERNFYNRHYVKSVQIRKFFWSIFSRIWTKYGEILRISPYSVQIQENKDQKNSVFGHNSCSDRSIAKVCNITKNWISLQVFS